jgi:hypothetical protein
MIMKRFIVFVMLATGMFLAMRKIAERAGSATRARCSEMCDRMMANMPEMCDRMLANMPESFPPNRMMADLEALKEQTARILEVLEERREADGPQE